MPAVSLPPKENALFKRILVSLGRRGAARGEPGLSLPSPGGHRAAPRGPRLGRAGRQSASLRLAPPPPGGRPPRPARAADRGAPEAWVPD